MPATSTAAPCPQCGAPASGRFCAACGAPLAGASCRSCDQPLTPGVRFCAHCGQPVTGAATAPTRAGAPSLGRWGPYAIGGAALLVVLVLLFRQEGRNRIASTPVGAPGSAAQAAGVPPDISQMTPRERFDRLYNRVMQASESGDTAQVAQFLPMALTAYTALDEVDADARYHLAMLRLHTGDLAGAKALADTILKSNPSHLFGFMIRGAAARFERNDGALAAAYRGFNDAYDKEIAAARPEYQDHQTALDRFLAEARAAVAAR